MPDGTEKNSKQDAKRIGRRSSLPDTPWRWDTLGDNPECMGCAGCVAACPFDALSMGSDALGYFRPILDPSKCPECGLCVRMCPAIVLPKKPSQEMPQLYAFVGANPDEVRNSTSGGIFPLLAKAVLDQGGKVVGTQWTKELGAESVIIDAVDQIKPLQKSKYVQPWTGSTFRSIQEELKAGLLVLYTGLPCQCAALRAFLHKSYSNLFVVDILCGMAPSTAYFQSYVGETWGKDNVAQYEFRYKSEQAKWHEHAAKVTMRNGQVTVVDRWSDHYQLMYHDHTMSPNHCEHCTYQAVPRYGDLSIGDFWGITQHDRAIPTANGVSAILVNTPKGQKLLDLVKPDDTTILKEEPLDYLGQNGYAIQGGHGFASLHRDAFVEAFRTTQSFEAAYAAARQGAGIKSTIDNATRRRNFRSLTPLHFDSRETHVVADQDSWAVEWQNDAITFTVHPDAVRKGNHAAFRLPAALEPSQAYILRVSGDVTTNHVEFSLHVKNSTTGEFKVVRRLLMDGHHARSFDESIFLQLPGPGFDEIMIASSHVYGPGATVAFRRVQLQMATAQ
ncbi:MAG: Coenzyme F420 hydrogenase/dehydrogenase, beta subunit C-terminal domain [Propionibacteriaceae bacterium]|nr:Coenzyme F420 hydrogenase/dehydrogenase, beta subunit C-terminal domain [Propionibacteriaceae bacterium]